MTNGFRSSMLISLRMSLRNIAKTFLGIGTGLALGLLVAWFAGESPFHVLKILLTSAFGSSYSFGMTLFYAVPLIFTGIAVAIPYRAGLFNIGAEGQLTIGSICSVLFCVAFPDLGTPWAIPLAAIAAFAGGALWGGLVGWLKARRGSHEVITTIMLNFIGAALASYIALYWIKDPMTQDVESIRIAPQYFLKAWNFLEGAPIGWVVAFAVLACLVLDWVLHFGSFGYSLKAVGSNERASELAGIRKEKIWIQSMALGGGFAGLVGLVTVLGHAHRYKIGLSADFGFMGIAVALVARGRILNVLWSALLFAALQKGAGDLEIETDTLTRDLVYWIQGLIILGVAAESMWDGLFHFIRKVIHQIRRGRATS